MSASPASASSFWVRSRSRVERPSALSCKLNLILRSRRSLRLEGGSREHWSLLRDGRLSDLLRMRAVIQCLLWSGARLTAHQRVEMEGGGLREPFEVVAAFEDGDDAPAAMAL